MTLHQAAWGARKILLDLPCTVRTRGTKFIDIECDSPLPVGALGELEDLHRKIRSHGKHRIILGLEGSGYPHGSTLGGKVCR